MSANETRLLAEMIDQEAWAEAITGLTLDELFEQEPELFQCVCTEWRAAHGE